MNIHEKIRTARMEKGWSMAELASRISAAEGGRPLAWQTIQQWESGNSAPKRTRLLFVEQVLGVPLADTPHSGVFDANVVNVVAGKRAYPVISAVQAGLLREISDPYSPGDGFDIEYGDDSWSEWTFALEIDGLSMLPEFRPGDRVLVDPKIAPRPGDFVVAKNTREEATFKKYRLRGQDARGNDVFELVPLNEDFPTIRSDEHQLVVIGVMVEHRKRYRRP